MSQYETSRCLFTFPFSDMRHFYTIYYQSSPVWLLSLPPLTPPAASCCSNDSHLSFPSPPPFPSRGAQKGGTTDGVAASAAECSLLKEIGKLHNVPRVGGTIFIMARYYDNLRWKIDCNCFSRISDGLSSPLLALFLAIDGDSFCLDRLSRGERASPQSFTIMSTKDALIFDG